MGGDSHLCASRVRLCAQSAAILQILHIYHLIFKLVVRSEAVSMLWRSCGFLFDCLGSLSQRLGERRARGTSESSSPSKSSESALGPTPGPPHETAAAALRCSCAQAPLRDSMPLWAAWCGLMIDFPSRRTKVSKMPKRLNSYRLYSTARKESQKSESAHQHAKCHSHKQIVAASSFLPTQAAGRLAEPSKTGFAPGCEKSQDENSKEQKVGSSARFEGI